MEEKIAELLRQLDAQRQLRESAERGEQDERKARAAGGGAASATYLTHCFAFSITAMSLCHKQSEMRVAQILLYMIDSGVRYGYICTGEASVFLCIRKALFNISCISRIKMCKRTMNYVSNGYLSARPLRSPFKRWLPNL